MHKGKNGDGHTIAIRFDRLDDPGERRAHAAAQMLAAARHGRRRQLIIALLEAVYQHHEQTGELLTATDIANASSRLQQPQPATEQHTPAAEQGSAQTTSATPQQSNHRTQRAPHLAHRDRQQLRQKHGLILQRTEEETA